MSNEPYRQRRSIRLKAYDYSQPGAYFVTICTFQRQMLFGEVVNGNLQLNEYGHITQDCWHSLPDHFFTVGVDAFVVMPNHVHSVLLIHDVGATHASPLPHRPHHSGPQPRSVGAVVGAFKSAASRRINALRHTPGTPIWQRNYYEHVVRNDRDLERIRVYIQDNPANWQEDENNPLNLP